MKRQQRTLGSIFRINLKDGHYTYGRILDKSSYAFYNYVTDNLQNENIEDIIQKPILFITSVFNDVITKGEWIKIGKPIPLEIKLQTLPMKFVQDVLDPNLFRLYDPNSGNMFPTTKDKIIGLERSAVWEAHAIEDRIRDHFNNIPCKWMEEDRKLFNY